MARFHAPPSAWIGGEVHLPPDEARHACEVLRLRKGDAISVFDGCGRLARGVLQEAGKHGAVVRVESESLIPEPSPAISLYQAVPKGKLMEWILEKATELGVSRIVPVMTERTVVQIEGADSAKKRERWQRTVLEACKQSGQTWMPEVAEPTTLARVLDEKEELGFALFGALREGARAIGDVLKEAAGVGRVSVFVGPEGDFTHAESEALVGRGVLPTSFGDLVLRVETASIFSLSVVAHLFRKGAPR